MPIPTPIKLSNLDLYKNFTGTNVDEYTASMVDFILSCKWFNTLEDDINITAIDTGTRRISIKFDALGMSYTNMDIDTYSGMDRLRIHNTGTDIFYSTDSCYKPGNCQAFTLETTNSSGFWIYAPNASSGNCRIFITKSKLIDTDILFNILITATDNSCYISMPNISKESISSYVNKPYWNCSNYVIEHFTYKGYEFPDLFLIYGGTDTSDELISFDSGVYFKLHKSLYLKVQ